LFAVDDAMANSNDAVIAHCTFPTPGEKEFDRAVMSELSPGRPLLFADDGSVIASNEARPRQQPFELAAQQRPWRAFIENDGKFQARRTRIENEQSIGHEFRRTR
jgi:hypothetical protein